MKTCKKSRQQQLALALCLALGLAAPQLHASPNELDNSPAAALMRQAAEVGLLDKASADLAALEKHHIQLAEKDRSASPKATHNVSNCNDTGPGSLRAAVANARSGDVIDLTGANCSVSQRIDLTSSLVTNADDLTIKNAAPQQAPIYAGLSSRIITHTGTGTLTLENVIVAYGSHSPLSGYAAGGCIYSKGNVVLKNSDVVFCIAGALHNYYVTGGAIHAAGTVKLINSQARLSSAISDGFSSGGAIYAKHVQLERSEVRESKSQGKISLGGGIATQSIIASNSTIEQNEASINNLHTESRIHGGGIFISDSATSASTIRNSTIAKNTVFTPSAAIGNNVPASGSGIHSGSENHTLTIQSSTIAENSFSRVKTSRGAIFLAGPAIIENSTITENRENNATHRPYGAGISMKNNGSLQMRSTIVAANELGTPAGRQHSDIGVFEPTQAISASISGTHNLVNRSTVPLGPNNIHNAATPPALGPLQHNGGPTKTRQPLPDSPVINAGLALGKAWDQRGSDFPRVVNGQADIGAIEADFDTAFINGFE